MRVCVGQPALNLGDQKLLTHLGHTEACFRKMPSVNR